MAAREADAPVLQATPSGHLLIDTALALDVSATDIRSQLRERLAQQAGSGTGGGANPAPGMIPEAVWDYILQHHLYHP